MIEQLQGVQKPEQHLAARHIRSFYQMMRSGWIGTETSEPMYACQSFHEWMDEMIAAGKDDLIKLIKKECRAFASIIVTVLRHRLRSIWQYIQCLELIDPKGPDMDQHATTAVWNALKDLCRRRDLNYHKCREEILKVRSEASNLDKDSEALVRMDLCSYLRDRKQIFVMTNQESPTPEYDKLCSVVFGIPLTSTFVESLFSKMSYNQSKIRTRLDDRTMDAILHLHDAGLPNPQCCLPSAMTLKVMIPRSLTDELQMSKHIDTSVCALFDGVRFHGEVTKVIYHDVHSQYMYHVVFTDGDQQDYWRHELEMIKCRCVVSESDEDEDL